MAHYLSFIKEMNINSGKEPMLSPTSPPVMPESIKKSYQQQFLPIRQQSLPCYHQPTPLPTPIRKSSMSATTRPRRKMKPPATKSSARHRSSKSETHLVLKPTRQRRYSLNVPKQQEEQSFLDYYYHQPQGSINPACISILLDHLLAYFHKHQNLTCTGQDIVNQLSTLLNTHDRRQTLCVANALPIIQLNGPPSHTIPDTDDILFRLPTMHHNLTASTHVFKELYQGVYTPLTRCYASRCPGDHTCYSPSCPHKHASDTKEGKVTPNTTNAPIPSLSSLPPRKTTRQRHALWIHSVPRTIVCATTLTERHRQETLYELVQTEMDFVGHLDYIKKCWIDPLSLHPQNNALIKHIFWNWLDVLQVSTSLMEALVTRQQQDHCIRHVGEVLLAHVGQFEPFIIYGAHQMVGKFYFELEKKRNPRFAQFVKETEQRPESERLELNGYLTKVTTRLGRYPILLNAILQWTPTNHPDHELLGRVLEILQDLLHRLDGQVGQATHQFELEQLSDRLLLNKGSQLELDLDSPHRQLVHQGKMQRTSLDGEIHVFLFDHLLVFTKVKMNQHLEYYRPLWKCIPLASLTFAVHDQLVDDKKTNKDQGRHLYIIAFQHKGQLGTPITLVTPNEISRRNWVEKLGRSIEGHMKKEQGVV